MYDAGRERSIIFQCIEKDMSYQELVEFGVAMCGNRVTA
jgi:hypothetical protein